MTGRSWRFSVAGAVGLVLLSAVSARAVESPEDIFKSLFGKKLRAVAATGSFRDDAVLAAEIVKTAGSTKLPDELLTVMYNAAFDLASRSVGGHPTAFKAMERLASAVPSQEIKCHQKLLGLLLRRLQMARTPSRRTRAAAQYVAALTKTANLLAKEGNFDTAVVYSRKAMSVAVNFKLSDASAIRERASRLLALKDIAKRRESLEKKFKADPADDAARTKLINFYVVDLDDPSAASKLLNDDCDEMLRTYVGLALKPIDQLEPAGLNDLARWYRGFADAASRASKVAMLRRAEAYYIRFLDLYTERDTKRLTASVGLASVRRKLKELGQSASAGGLTVAGGSVSISDAWPCSTGGLVFVWRDSAWVGAATGTAGSIARAGKPTARGKAHITADKAMDLGDGAFLAARAVNERLLTACMKSNELTVEAMIRPDDISQSGPARIISFSQDGQDRNFTIGQEKSALVFRIRTVSSSDQNKTIPLFKMAGEKWHHVVFTWRVEKDDFSGKSTGRFASYLNGREMAEGKRAVSGLLSGWKPMHLLFGDEYADKRDWRGRLKGVAIYSRAISPKEITAKYKTVKAAIDSGNSPTKSTESDKPPTRPPLRD